MNIIEKCDFGRAWAGVGADNVSSSIQSKVISLHCIQYTSKCDCQPNLLWTSLHSGIECMNNLPILFTARIQKSEADCFLNLLKPARLLKFPGSRDFLALCSWSRAAFSSTSSRQSGPRHCVLLLTTICWIETFSLTFLQKSLFENSTIFIEFCTDFDEILSEFRQIS